MVGISTCVVGILAEYDGDCGEIKDGVEAAQVK
jgi:hypothetical protein